MVDPEGPACTCPNDVSVTDEDIAREHGHRTGCPRGAWIVSLVPHPAGPDPARDARVDAYRDRERRRAVRVLDRFMELHADDVDVSTGARARIVAGERFVEAVGDYVLARLGERASAGGCPNDCGHTDCAEHGTERE